jgi:hypothetical protein
MNNNYDFKEFFPMRKVTLALLLLLVAASADRALAHGFRISVDGGKLNLVSEDPTAGGLPIYKVQSLLGPANYKSSDHPGFDPQSGFSNGDQVSFNVLGPLLYSTGSGDPIPSPVDMEISPQDILIPGSVTVTGSSGFQTGFLIGEYSGGSLSEFEHQLYYSISVPGSVPIGAYAITLQLTGVNSLGQPFTPSDPFVAFFNNGLSVGSLPGVAQTLYNAAVPEPSSVVLLSLAGLGLVAFRLRRQPRS